jgi:hypothetical protein
MPMIVRQTHMRLARETRNAPSPAPWWALPIIWLRGTDVACPTLILPSTFVNFFQLSLKLSCFHARLQRHFPWTGPCSFGPTQPKRKTFIRSACLSPLMPTTRHLDSDGNVRLENLPSRSSSSFHSLRYGNSRLCGFG